MNLYLFYICVILIFLNRVSSIKLKNENKKNKVITERAERKQVKYDYSSLKEKLHLKSKDGSDRTKEKKDGTDRIDKIIGTEEEASSVNKGKNTIASESLNTDNEYVKCMNLIESEFKDKTDSKNLKYKEELEKLCLKKKAEDEKEISDSKKKKDIDDKNDGRSAENDILEKRNKEIKSQLGLSSKMIVSNEALNESLSEIKNCYHNYREKCPLNWDISKDNAEYCIAPDSYVGPCEKKMNNNIDISEKKIIENKCLVYWACDHNCVQDFENYLCPIDWLKVNEESCKAPDNYVGKCLNIIKFSNMSNKEKLIYSNLCDIRWPCKEACQRDYSLLCPDGWVEINNEYCIATNSYKGNCKKKMYFKHLDKVMKQNIEQKCQFNYPCVNSCEKNYGGLCPNLWTPVNKNECAPSEYYNGNCKESYIFKNINIDEKKQFEKLCGVSYRCLEKCKRDYSYNCPIGWKETLSYCLAPNSYKYHCNKLMKKNMNEKEKIHISKHCHVFWPCSNYEIILKNLIYDNISEEDYVSIVNGPVENTTGDIIYT